MNIDQWLETIPPLSVYLIVGLVVMTESLGVPLPGEIVLVSAALLSSTHPGLSPLWIGVLASTGAIVGDSIGYAIGRKGGKRLFDWAGRKFPKHFGPTHVANAQRMFDKYGMWAVFLGRFIAVLRIFAGPLAGSLHMRYPKFLVANALGGIVWAGGTTLLIYKLGEVADQWMKGVQWIGLGVALIVGATVTLIMKKRMGRAHSEETPKPLPERAQ
jgi:membrane protein DedA with SNARE-associated domain